MNSKILIATSLIWLACASIVMTSCKTDIDTLDTYRDIAFMWSFLDKSDTANYVIIQKGFVNPNENANILAQNPDSIYFDNLVVNLEEWNGPNKINTYPMTLVNLANEGFVKDSGLFNTQDNFAYKLVKALNPNHTYKVSAIHNGKEFRASTPVVNIDKMTLNVNSINWRDSSRRINFTPSNNETVSFSSGGGGVVYDLILSFSYFDVFSSHPLDTIAHVVNWKVLDKEEIPTATTKFQYIKSNDFFNSILTGIPDAVSGQNRYMGFVKFGLYAGSQRILNYINQKSAQQGLTANQVNPEFKEGFETDDTYGLVDTRGTAIYFNLSLSDSTIFYLKTKQDLVPKNIKGRIFK